MTEQTERFVVIRSTQTTARYRCETDVVVDETDSASSAGDAPRLSAEIGRPLASVLVGRTRTLETRTKE